jgi:hypothetical protein
MSPNSSGRQFTEAPPPEGKLNLQANFSLNTYPVPCESAVTDNQNGISTITRIMRISNDENGLPFYAGDISALARSLHNHTLRNTPGRGNVEHACASGGFAEFSALPCEAVANETNRPAESCLDVDFVELQRCLRYFDLQGIDTLACEISHQGLVLGAVVRILPRTKLSEHSVNELLLANHRFESALLGGS